MWKFTGRSEGKDGADGENQWKLRPPSSFDSPALAVAWADGRSMLSVLTTKDVFILREQAMLAHYKDTVKQRIFKIGEAMIVSIQLAVVQTGQSTLSLTKLDTLATAELKPEMQIKGLSIFERNLAVWDNQRVLVYEVDDRGTAATVGKLNLFMGMTT